jgi:hypothetical protein
VTLITIRQTGGLLDQPNAEVSFDQQPGFPVTVRDPFSAEEEAQLAWYFEEYLRFPFTDQVRAQAAAVNIQRYGQGLFTQLFKQNEQVYAHYRRALGPGVQTLRFQISGAPNFHQLHWEALWDPERPRPFALDATLVRSGVQPILHTLNVQPSPTINLLVVTARPRGGRDVGYRTIARPLVEMLGQTQLPVQVDMVLPHHPFRLARRGLDL